MFWISDRNFFLLRVIDYSIRFNGFSCLRLADVRNLEAPHDYEKFVLQALKHRREKLFRQPSINLTSIETILVSASKVFPLITIHREKINPDVCGIGKVLSIESDSVSMLDIGPDALWDGEPTSRKLRDITRVDFGGGYEEALNLVGGRPPVPSKSRRKTATSKPGL
jgi:hypothetical protein